MFDAEFRYKNMKLKFLFIILLFTSTSIFAGTLPQFKASFYVEVMGFTLGQAKHNLTCSKKNTLTQTCNLISTAEPSRFMRRFINESSVEKITFEQNSSNFYWLKYQKELTRRYSDRTEIKTTTLIRDEINQLIIFEEQQKQWRNKTNVFDEISIVYAIQHAMLNNLPLNNFYLQRDKDQTAVNIEINHKTRHIDLPFASFLKTTVVTFKNNNMEGTIWLLNNYNYFPAKIAIHNKENNKTITLELNTLTQL